MRYVKSLMPLLMFLPLSSCSDEVRSGPEPTSSAGSTLREISQAETAWSQAAPSSYDMTVQRGCFCNIEPVDDARVTVVDGQVDSALGSDEGQRHSVPLTPEQHMPWFTVSGQFRMMREALAGGLVVTASFEPSNGRPRSFTFRPDSDMPSTDADTVFDVTEFSRR